MMAFGKELNDIESFSIDNDKLIKITRLHPGSTTCRMETIITKEIFVECYKEWIEKDKELNNGKI